jgi:hypothetical protein
MASNWERLLFHIGLIVIALSLPKSLISLSIVAEGAEKEKAGKTIPETTPERSPITQKRVFIISGPGVFTYS